MTLITASILAADFGKLQAEVDSIVGVCDWVQADVMDGHFVSNLSFGAPVLRSLRLPLPLDVHLMVTNPADRIAEFAPLKPANITFHAEAVKTTKDRRALIQAIRAMGATAGIALNPDTPISAIGDVIGEVDLVLVMSVHPGFSGQAFITDVLQKVRALRAAHPDLMIQIDGGIDAASAKAARDAGANNLVAASAIFRAADRAKAVAVLRGTH